MFEIGDVVAYVWGNQVRTGKIVGWEYDEGNVWEVTVTDSMNAYFSDDQLRLAHDPNAKPWQFAEFITKNTH